MLRRRPACIVIVGLVLVLAACSPKRVLRSPVPPAASVVEPAPPPVDGEQGLGRGEPVEGTGRADGEHHELVARRTPDGEERQQAGDAAATGWCVHVVQRRRRSGASS